MSAIAARGGSVDDAEMRAQRLLVRTRVDIPTPIAAAFSLLALARCGPGTRTGTLDATVAPDVIATPDTAIAPDTFPVNPARHAVRISEGGGAVCVLMSDRTVWCWGANELGQLGNGSETPSQRPAPVPGITDAVAMGGGDLACAVTSSGDVSCWGAGGADPWLCDISPYLLPNAIDVHDAVGITTVSGEAVATLRDGSCASWGIPYWHEFSCHGNPPVNYTPTAYGPCGVGGAFSRECTVMDDGRQLCTLDGLAPFVAIAASGSFTGECYLTEQRTVICEGNVLWSFMPSAPAVPPNRTPPPMQIQGLDRILDVHLGMNHACALRDDGKVFCWGYGTGGQLGNTTGALEGMPFEVPGVRDTIQIAIDDGLGCALDLHGVVMCWGTIVQSFAPVRVDF